MTILDPFMDQFMDHFLHFFDILVSKPLSKPRGCPKSGKSVKISEKQWKTVIFDTFCKSLWV